MFGGFARQSQLVYVDEGVGNKSSYVDCEHRHRCNRGPFRPLGLLGAFGRSCLFGGLALWSFGLSFGLYVCHWSPLWIIGAVLCLALSAFFAHVTVNKILLATYLRVGFSTPKAAYAVAPPARDPFQKIVSMATTSTPLSRSPVDTL